MNQSNLVSRLATSTVGGGPPPQHATDAAHPWNPDSVVKQFVQEWDPVFLDKDTREEMLRSLRGKLRAAFAAGAEEGALEASVDAAFEAGSRLPPTTSATDVEATPAPEGIRKAVSAAAPIVQFRTLNNDLLHELTEQAEVLAGAVENIPLSVHLMAEIRSIAQRAFAMGQMSEHANGYLPMVHIDSIASVIFHQTCDDLTLTFNAESDRSLLWSAEAHGQVAAAATQIDALKALLRQIIDENDRKSAALRGVLKAAP